MAETKNGGRIERGKVISVANGLYTVASFDRTGIEIPGIPAVDGSQYEVGETVHFVSFPDGTGWIACGRSATAPASGSVTGVKGNEEAEYRSGQVNLTPEHIGALPLTGGVLSGSVAISITGRGYNLTDSSGTRYGGLYENGDNLWVGAASSTSPHHRGTHGNTYISAGYSTNSNAGNSTIYISVPSLSGGVWSHTAYGVLHAGNYGDYALPRSGGVLTGNLVVGQLADTVDRNVTVRNSLGNVAINVSSAGNHGLYSSTKGGWIIYCNPEANSVNSLAVIPRPLYVTGNFASTGEVHAGGKGASSDGKTGSILSTAGHLYMQATSGSHIYFYYGTSTSVTSQLYESASGTLTCSGFFQAKLYNGSSAQVVGSNGTNGNRVALFATPGATTFQIGAQWGGTTYSTKSVTVSSSDKRLKENIKDTTVEAMPIINQIKVREFDWTDNRAEKHQPIGMVADEIEKLDHRLAVGGGYEKDGSMNIKSVDTFYLVGYIVKAVQELSAEINRMKGEAA